MKIKLKDKDVTYVIIRKRVKNINIRMKPDGILYISANKQVKREYIEQLLLSRENTICKWLIKAEQMRKEEENPSYQAGDVITYLGINYIIEIIGERKEKITIKDERFIIEQKDADNERKRIILVDKYLNSESERIFNQLLNDVYLLFKNSGIELPTLKIRKMKKRWGTCYVTKGIVILSKRLIHYPKDLISYVICHEICHFIEPNHSKLFYKEMKRRMPDWQERQKRLVNFKVNR